jgi:hypothetical protein
MAIFSTLKLVAAKKPTFVSPVQARRNKLSTRLWEQIELAKAQRNGTVFAPTRTKTIRDEDGNTRTVERSRRIKQWWFVSEAGKVCIAVRYGARVLELAKGKSAIEVATPAELINALETIRSAVDAGELDVQLETASNSLRSSFDS